MSSRSNGGAGSAALAKTRLGIWSPFDRWLLLSPQITAPSPEATGCWVLPDARLCRVPALLASVLAGVFSWPRRAVDRARAYSIVASG